MSNIRKTGYFVEVDVCGQEEDNADVVRAVRESANKTGVHVKVIELESPSGWPFVRLTSASRHDLRSWLNVHGFEDEKIVDARNPNAVPRRRL